MLPLGGVPEGGSEMGRRAKGGQVERVTKRGTDKVCLMKRMNYKVISQFSTKVNG